MKKYILTILMCLVCSVGWCGVDFDGVDDYLDCTVIDNTGNITISVWIKFKTLDAITGDRNLYAISTWSETDPPFNTWEKALMIRESDKVAAFYVYDGGAKFVYGTTAISAGTWYNITGRYDGVNIEIFLNGVSENTTAAGASFNYTTPQLLINGIYASDVGGTPSWGDNIVADFAWWSVDLSDVEIFLLASSRVKRLPLQISPSNLQTYYPFDDLSDGTAVDTSTLKDISGNARDCHGDAIGEGGTAVAEEVLSYP